MDYPHLQTKAADSRYALAAHYLEPCDVIYEVGGSRLHDFISPHFHTSIIQVDPAADHEDMEPCVVMHTVPVCDFDFSVTTEGCGDDGDQWKGLCLLGLELHDRQYGDGGPESMAKLCSAIGDFDVIVVDFVPMNKHANMQSLMVHGACERTGKVLAVELNTTMVLDAGFPSPNDSFRKERKFRVYSI